MGDTERVNHGKEPRLPKDHNARDEALDGLIAVRAKTHGDFAQTGRCAQEIKETFRNWKPGWEALEPYQREAMDQMAQKFARILTGNPKEPDHWRDLEGYARLVEVRL